MKHNLRRHELMGLLFIFLAATCIGIGLYFTLMGAIGRPLLRQSTDYFLKGKEFILFPLFYGVGALLWELGKIEIKEATPGKIREGEE
ncbi:MAG: hypothetical protein NT001_05755 [Candidatus Woesearchaeota archaeon]|nr:hypothetical protein [Candidatus Woesearchaeota archaeon]